MTEVTRSCLNCKADIRRRGPNAKRCVPCQAEYSKKPSRLAARACEYCRVEYVPRGHKQKWCKDCVWDAASRYRVSRYGAQGVEQYRNDLARGSRTAACSVCGESFTYPYFGGTDRKFCDVHVPQNVAGERAKRTAKFPCCSTCGLSSDMLDENGQCHRHNPPGTRRERLCEICSAPFLTVMSRPNRVCSTACRNARRRPLSELRPCELCNGNYYPTHPQQKYCTVCTGGTKRGGHRATRYKISIAEVEALEARFDGLCWICREKTGTCVDHDHVAGTVRGWLCLPCNGALHYLDRPRWVGQATAYLAEASRGVASDIRSGAFGRRPANVVGLPGEIPAA